MSQLTPEQFEQVQRIFLEVRELAAEQRGPALAAYADDVRREVISLLSADEGCGEFLERPALNTDTESMTSVAPDKPTYPDRVGPYRLLQQIGEGGILTVFLAEQVEPVQPKVAVKLINPGMDSKQVLSRFHADPQALAMMDQTSIARFFDVGTTDNGLPYFVMELVRGIPIDDFCEQNALSLIERLDLIGQVCRAVHHAHRKGVNHRDLKPSNVLVGMGEEGPVAKVIDFGIAKALDARLSESTLFTEFGQMVGTLEYMSPEQAEMSVVDIDTRSEV